MKETKMSSARKVAVITGASRGIGAALVDAYRGLDYAVVATARSIGPTSDDQILAVQGDVADRKRPSVQFPKAWLGSGVSIR
jgi:NAD(P)-dependent dehydrogenase (short-subunit alcohol dehydrogenase family)